MVLSFFLGLRICPLRHCLGQISNLGKGVGAGEGWFEYLKCLSRFHLASRQGHELKKTPLQGTENPFRFEQKIGPAP
jgi:hypothetical protein